MNIGRVLASIHYVCQEKAYWVDNIVIKHWIDEVWMHFVLGREGKGTYFLVVLLSFHPMGSCCDITKGCNMEVGSSWWLYL